MSASILVKREQYVLKMTNILDACQSVEMMNRSSSA
jgi:hypothetical protein